MQVDLLSAAIKCFEDASHHHGNLTTLRTVAVLGYTSELRIGLPLQIEGDLERIASQVESYYEPLLSRVKWNQFGFSCLLSPASVSLCFMAGNEEKYVKIDGSKFRQLWRDAQMSEEAFAKKIGMKRTNVQRHKRDGVRGMQKDLFQKMARGLGTEPDVLRERLRPEREKWVPFKLSMDLYEALQMLAGRRTVEEYLVEHVRERSKK